jgi:RNA polymerase sigma factor (TIGR02999 family)
LVNEAALRLLGEQSVPQGKGRAWFFGAVAAVMRRVLIDHARKRNAQRRSGGWARVPLDTAVEYLETTHRIDLVDLDDALQQLEALNPRQSAIVERRFFGGFEMPEIAEQLGVSLSTVENDWRIARAWLRQQLAEGRP